MRVKTFLPAMAFLLAATAFTAAFSFVPMTASLSPSGTQSIVSFKITNDSAQQIAVMIKVMTRSIDLDGNEVNKDVGKEFIVFPTRVVVQPNSFQTVKLQYKGTASLPAELCYRVIAEQVPIDFTKQETSGVRVLFRYIAALYVTPPKAAYKLEIESAVGAVNDGKNGLWLVVRNAGNRHALISNPALRLSKDGATGDNAISGAAMGSLEGQNILPLSARKVFVPWESAEAGVSYTGTINAEIE